MSIKNNTTSLQEVLEALSNKAVDSPEPALQDKTVSPTTSQQSVTADSGYDGLGTVTVNAISIKSFIVRLPDNNELPVYRDSDNNYMFIFEDTGGTELSVELVFK